MQSLVQIVGVFTVCLAASFNAWAQATAEPSELQVQVWAAACMACHGTMAKPKALDDLWLGSQQIP
ncbi:MAG: hypothetical protein IPI14_13460 [Polaromonas sp.]|nr:hypothetical protein [Polaromonas sp.]